MNKTKPQADIMLNVIQVAQQLLKEGTFYLYSWLTFKLGRVTDKQTAMWHLFLDAQYFVASVFLEYSQIQLGLKSD